MVEGMTYSLYLCEMRVRIISWQAGNTSLVCGLSTPRRVAASPRRRVKQCYFFKQGLAVNPDPRPIQHIAVVLNIVGNNSVAQLFEVAAHYTRAREEIAKHPLAAIAHGMDAFLQKR